MSESQLTALADLQGPRLMQGTHDHSHETTATLTDGACNLGLTALRKSLSVWRRGIRPDPDSLTVFRMGRCASANCRSRASAETRAITALAHALIWGARSMRAVTAPPAQRKSAS